MNQFRDFPLQNECEVGKTRGQEDGPPNFTFGFENKECVAVSIEFHTFHKNTVTVPCVGSD